MKTTTPVIMLLLCLIISVQSIAQRENTLKGVNYITSPLRQVNYYPDSIRVEFPAQKAFIIFTLKNITRDINFIDSFPENLQEWLKQISSGVADTATPMKVSIVPAGKYTDTRITIENAPPKTTRIISKKNEIKELLPPGWELSITGNDQKKIFIYAQTWQDLELVSQQDFKLTKEKIKDEISAHPMMRKGLVARVIQQDNKVTYSEMKHRSVHDFISLSGNGGFGFLNDKFYPTLDLELSLQFSDRFDRKNHLASLVYSNMFFAEKKADRGYRSNINSFLSLEWKKNLHDDRHPTYIGLGAGYLIHREGDYFKGATYKFYGTTKVGRYSFTPEVYLTNGNKEFAFGLRFGYSF